MNKNLKETSLFPQEVYDNLPELLKECCKEFKDPRERDVFLIGALAVLSGCFSGLRGKYSKDFVFPNFFVMIVAPAGSGKQVMKYARMLAEVLHQMLIKASLQPKREVFQPKDGDKLGVNQEEEKKQEKEKAPDIKVLLIPGNTSSAMIYQHLQTNGGIGIIAETEIDTLSISLNQDWGNFSDLLRKAFHHETLSISRKLEKQFYEISNPRLSIVLTGTPGQMRKLIGSPENGLMSRFAYYVYGSDLEWKSQKPCDACPDLDEFMMEKAKLIAALATRLESSKPIFKMSSDQFDVLDSYFKGKVEELRSFGMEDAAGTLYRMGLIAFRICMVLSVLRNADSIGKAEGIHSSEQDLEISLTLAEVLFYHSLEAYKLLPKEKVVLHNPGMVRFYGYLPEGEFTTDEAQKTGGKISIKERTVRNYLKELVEKGFLQQIAHGKYKKVKMEEETN